MTTTTRMKTMSAGLAGLFLMTAGSAFGVTIDFESVGVNPVTRIDTTVTGVDISATGGIGEAWVYDTTRSSGNDPDLTGPFTEVTSGNSYAPGNVLIVQENRRGGPDDAAGGGSLTFDFDDAVLLQSLNVFDINDNSSITLFEVSGGTQTISLANSEETGLINHYEHLTFNNVAITGFTLDLSASGAISDIEFSAVPIPPAVWLFGSALLGLAGVGYRRTAATA